MTTFEVHYSFTCPSCLKPNEGREHFIASDKVDARDRAHAAAHCSQCHSKLPLNHAFATRIKELKQGG
jgi:hypothetical protein